MRKPVDARGCYLSSCIIFISIALFTFFIAGCAVFAPVSLIGTGVLLSEERKVDVNVSDKYIHTKIRSAFYESKLKDKISVIELSVIEGRVLLVGNVDSKSVAEEAVSRAWGVRGVREVINELVVIRPEDRSAFDVMLNFKTSSYITAKLISTKGVSSMNYSVLVNGDIAYVFGIFKSEEELKKVIWIVGNTNGIGKIVNHAISKNDPRRWDMKK